MDRYRSGILVVPVRNWRSVYRVFKPVRKRHQREGYLRQRHPLSFAVAIFLLAGLFLTGILCHGCHSHEEELRLLDWLPSALAQEGAKPVGHIAGIVRYTGQLPRPRRVETNEGGVLEIADLEVHPQTLGAREVFVCVENPPVVRQEAPHQAVVVDQINLRFQPRVLGALAGQEVRFENNDSCNHGVQTLSSIPANQINATTGPGTPIVHRFQAQREPIPIGCALHPWMRAYLYVLPHSFFAVTDQRGRFRITDLPEGSYRVRFSHPLTGWQTLREVAVRPNQTTTVMIIWQSLKPDSK